MYLDSVLNVTACVVLVCSIGAYLTALRMRQGAPCRWQPWNISDITIVFLSGYTLYLLAPQVIEVVPWCTRRVVLLVFVSAPVLCLVITLSKIKQQHLLSAWRLAPITWKTCALWCGGALILQLVTLVAYAVLLRITGEASDGAGCLTDIADLVAFSIGAMLAPVYEEVLFRHIALVSLKRKLGLCTAATLITVVFTAMHGVYVANSVFLVPYGMLALARIRTKSTLTPLLMHSVVNGMMVIVRIGLFIYMRTRA